METRTSTDLCCAGGKDVQEWHAQSPSARDQTSASCSSPGGSLSRQSVSTSTLEVAYSTFSVDSGTTGRKDRESDEAYGIRARQAKTAHVEAALDAEVDETAQLGTFETSEDPFISGGVAELYVAALGNLDDTPVEDVLLYKELKPPQPGQPASKWEETTAAFKNGMLHTLRQGKAGKMRRVKVVKKGEEYCGVLMKYYPHGSVVQLLINNPDMASQQRLMIMLKAAVALEDFHSRHAIHLDIKPDNLVVHIAADGTYEVVIVDFDVAAELPVAWWHYANVIGTPGFRAPELNAPTAEARVEAGGYGPHSDIWSLGATCYQIMDPSNPGRLWRPPADLPRHCHERLRKLLRRMCAKECCARPSMAEVVAQLEDILAAMQQQPPPPQQQQQRRPRAKMCAAVRRAGAKAKAACKRVAGRFFGSCAGSRA